MKIERIEFGEKFKSALEAELNANGLSSNEATFFMLTNTQRFNVNVLYKIPDHPLLVQEFVWGDYDIAPNFPILNGFLEYWQKNLDGKIRHVMWNSVPVFSEGKYIEPKLRSASALLALH